MAHSIFNFCQLFSRVITPASSGASPSVNDILTGAKFGPTDLQKWLFSDGSLSPYLDPTLYITTGPSGLTLQKSNPESQTFDTVLSDVGRSLGKFCGTDLPKKITTGSDEVMIYHYIEGDPTKSTWHLDWSTDNFICGEEIKADIGSIASPNYPDPYDQNRRCEWTITVNSRYSVTLTFKE